MYTIILAALPEVSTNHSAPPVAITEVICYICLLVIKNPQGKYALLVIAVGCTFSIFPILWSGESFTTHPLITLSDG